MNSSNVLFSKTQQQILGLLYSQPARDFYTNEIIRLAKSGTGSVQRELAKLTAAGLITVAQLGNQRRYQANASIPFFAELRGIILKTFGLADILKDALSPISKQITVAFIYGSVAKQEDTAKSDIDLLLITDQLTYSEFFQHIEKAEKKLNRKINPTFYTRSELILKQNEDNHFISAIFKQAKIFLIGSEDELRTVVTN